MEFSTEQICSLDRDLWSTAWLMHDKPVKINGKLQEIGSLEELGKLANFAKNQRDRKPISVPILRYIAPDAIACVLPPSADLLADLPVVARQRLGDSLCEALASGYSPCSAARALSLDPIGVCRKIKNLRKYLT